MRCKLLFIAIIFFAAGNFLASAEAQPRLSNSIVSDEPNPPAVRNAALIALYHNLTVTVALQGTGCSRERSMDDVALKAHFSPQLVSILFADVRSLRWADPQHAGKAYTIKARATRFSEQPPATTRVRLRNRQTLHGQVRAAGDLEFTLAIHDSGEVKRLRYRDVQGLSDPATTRGRCQKDSREHWTVTGRHRHTASANSFISRTYQSDRDGPLDQKRHAGLYAVRKASNMNFLVRYDHSL